MFQHWNRGSVSVSSLQITDLIFWSTKRSWALDFMSVGCSATLQIRPLFQHLNADFIYNNSIRIHSFPRCELFALLPCWARELTMLVLHSAGGWLPLLWQTWAKKGQNGDPEAASRAALRPGSGRALWLPTSTACKHVFKFRRVRRKWNYLHLKIKYMFH